jgi:hypothetical protein
VRQDTPVCRHRYSHIGALARRLLRYLKQLPAMEKIAIIQFWQVLLFGDNLYDGLVHVAKIEK